MGYAAETEWKFEKSGLDGACQLFGVNIFEYEWKSTGGVACFGDPRYGNLRGFHVYEAIINGACRRFAAGELSNGVWGFCLKEEGEP